MKDALIFLTDGFEEIEALATADILRRGGLDVAMVSLTGSRVVTGGHKIPVTADLMFDEVASAEARMLILPGGTVEIDHHDGLKALIRKQLSAGRKVAAICAAPMVLGGMGLLEGRRATCYPGYEHYLRGATLSTEAVVVDGDITTGRGPGLTFDFALSLVAQLAGEQKSRDVAGALLLK